MQKQHLRVSTITLSGEYMLLNVIKNYSKTYIHKYMHTCIPTYVHTYLHTHTYIHPLHQLFHRTFFRVGGTRTDSCLCTARRVIGQGQICPPDKAQGRRHLKSLNQLFLDQPFGSLTSGQNQLHLLAADGL